jgi:prepilin-type N-terminal cleavage/methylation domain-containing protein
MRPRNDSETRTRRALRRGFTLVELLVAMVIAAIVMYGVYMLYEQSTSAFRVQNQLTDMQQQLRFGLEQVKRDIERAGFLSTSNSAVDGDVCLNATGAPLRGIIVRRDAEEGWDTTHLPGSNQNVLPSSVTLFGDFWSPGPFRVFSVAGNQLVLDGNFWYDGNTFPTNDVIRAWFPQGRLVRFVTQAGWELYLTVQAVLPGGGGPAGANWPVLVLQQSIPTVYASDGCGVMGTGNGALVNPVGYVRYRIAQDTRANTPADKYDLIREELRADDPVTGIVPQSQLTIAEYAIDLQLYDFMFDETLDRSVPQVTRISVSGAYEDVTQVVAVGGGGRLSAADSTADPHRLRAVTLLLSVRTPDEDPNVAFRPRQNRFARLTTFEVDPQRGGAARVRTLSTRVMLNNFLMRNLIP